MEEKKVNAHPTTLAQFYQQLQFLLAADNPLPTAFAEIATATRGPLKRVCETLAADAEQGLNLASALRRHPRHFPAIHVKALAASPQALPSLAAICQNHERFLTDVVAKLTSLIALIFLSIGMLSAIVLLFGPALVAGELDLLEQYGGWNVKPSFFLQAVDATAFWWALVSLGTCGLLLMLLVLLHGRSHGIAARLLCLAPGTAALYQARDYGVVCALWAVMLRAGLDNHDLVEDLDELMLHPRVRKQVTEWRGQLTERRTLTDAIYSDERVDPHFRYYFGTSEEGRITALEHGAERFRTRCEDAGKRAARVWALVGIVGTLGAFWLMGSGAFQYIRSTFF